MSFHEPIDPLLGRKDVECMVGLKRSRIDDLRRSGEFPQPENFKSRRHNRWRRSTIEKWLEDQRVG